MIGKRKRQTSTEHKEHYVVDEKSSPFMIVEAYRNLMANINFAIPKKEDGRAKIVCVSSCFQGEGKSTTASNLALTCARTGYRTVIVDCDMRKPQVKRFMNLRVTKGLITLLSGGATLEEVLIKDVAPNLDVVPTTHSAPNPTYLLNTDTFKELINTLAGQYDYVIIDTPPISVVSDALIIGKQADGIAIVARQFVSNHKAIKEVLEQIEFAECRFIGFVWYGFALSGKGSYYSRGYRYGSRYGYKYGYKYGYSEGDHRTSSSSSGSKGKTKKDKKK